MWWQVLVMTALVVGRLSEGRVCDSYHKDDAASRRLEVAPRDDPEGRFLKGKMSLSQDTVSLADILLAILYQYDDRKPLSHDAAPQPQQPVSGGESWSKDTEGNTDSSQVEVMGEGGAYPRSAPDNCYVRPQCQTESSTDTALQGRSCAPPAAESTDLQHNLPTIPNSTLRTILSKDKQAVGWAFLY